MSFVSTVLQRLEVALNFVLMVLRGLTVGQWKDLISAVLGAAGTGFLFFGSYAYEPLAGSPFGGPILEKHNAEVRGGNDARNRRQWVGLALLCLSFVAQIVGVFLPAHSSQN